MSRTVNWSKTATFFEGDWHEGNVPIMGVRTHAAWLCTSVFDGARAFEGVAPDLDLHCARVNESAKVMDLKPLVSTEAWVGLVGEGRKRFDRDAELYIRPMYWPEDAAAGAVRPDPETTRWCLTLYSCRCRSRPAPPSRCRRSAARHPHRSKPRPAASIRTTRAR